MIDALRTPDERFVNLPDYPWPPHHVDDLPGTPGLRIHYLDEGPDDAAQTWLCLHGEPTWSYLYRRMIPPILAAGHRVIAPDLPGFGRSDKPCDDAVHTFDFHRGVLLALVERLDLQGVVLVVQDWGGMLGLTLPIAAPSRYVGLLAMNTGFATGEEPLGPDFLAWRAYNDNTPDLPVGGLLAQACPHLTTAEAAAYDAPFPDASYKAGVRRFPNLVPDHPAADGTVISRQARDWFRTRWHGRTFMAAGMTDPVLGGPAMRALARQVRGSPPPLELQQGGHFLQEWGNLFIGEALLRLG